MRLELTLPQLAAVTRTGQDVCVIAGPGSGKTRVLVRRFAWQVEQQSVSPLRILAITFTEKAAGEIKERLFREFSHSPGQQQQIQRAYVSTVHGFCARLLRENAIAAGLNPEFTVFDQRRSAAELAAATVEALDQVYRTQPEALRALLDGWAASNPARSLEDIYNGLRTGNTPVSDVLDFEEIDPQPAVDALLDSVEQLIGEMSDLKTAAQQRKVDEAHEWLSAARALTDPPVLAEHFALLDGFKFTKNGIKREHPAYDLISVVKEEHIPLARRLLLGAYYAPQKELIGECLQLLHRRYRERKNRRDALDFDDLQERTLQLLEDQPEVRQTIQDSFDAILMDELQDTNPLQWRLLDLLRRPGMFFGVGDVNQSIYGFRHADPRVFIGYREQLQSAGFEIDRLQANYRSRAEILTLVNGVLGREHGIEPHTLEPQGLFAAKGEPSIEVAVALGENADAAAEVEASWIASRIRELQGRLLVGALDPRPAQFGDFAILVRTTDSLTRIEPALQAFQIPYLMSRGKTFFEEQEVVDLVNALRILANSRDEVALLAVLRSPLVGAGDETILRLSRSSGLANALEHWDLDRDAFDASDWERLEAFRREYRALRCEIDDESPDHLLQRLMDVSDYEAALSPGERANIEKLLELVRGLASEGSLTLPGLVTELEALQAARSEANAPPIGPQDAVHVVTMHSAKGLEWPVVFLASLQKGTRRSSPPLTYSPETGLGAVWRIPGSDESEGDPSQEAWVQVTQARERQEANRLLYVAMTRAEEHLVLSYAETKNSNRAWPDLIEITLGLRPSGGPSPAAVVQTALGVPVRWQVIDRVRENRFHPIAGRDSSLWEPWVVEPASGTGESPLVRLELQQAGVFSVCPRRYGLSETHGTWSEIAGEDTKALLLEAIQGSPLWTRYRRGRQREHDVQLLIEWNGLIVQGTIDLWWEEPEGHSVVAALTDDPLQAQLQALLFERWRGQPPAELHCFEAGSPLLLAADPQAAGRFLASVVQAHREFRYPPQPGLHCATCAWAGTVCQEGSAWHQESSGV